MNRILFGFALLTLSALAESQTSAWNTPQEPFKIFGNTYYVGTHGLSAVLVTSDAGHVLIDGDLPESVPLIVGSITKLGFRIEDVKFILNSHTHFDHAGGIAELQRKSGAMVVSSSYGVGALKRGQGSPEDPQFKTAQPFPKVARARIIKDRDVLKVGTNELTVIYTPGHTPGGTSWTWKSCEGDHCLTLVYGDSLNAVSSDGFRFTGSDALKALRASLALFETLPCDILVSAHPEQSALWERLERKDLVDKNGCRAYAAGARERLEKRLESERAPR